MFRLYWIIALIMTSSLAAYFSKQYNDSGKTLHFWLLMSFGVCGMYLWTVVSRRSDNLVFDNVLFDMILDVVYVVVFICLGCAAAFRPVNWIGVVAVLLGLLLMKL